MLSHLRIRASLVRTVLVAALAFTLGSASVVFALVVDGQVLACYNNATGILRLATPTKPCMEAAGYGFLRETSISWNQIGPQGPAGATGAQGATGATGAQGIQGPAGPAAAPGAVTPEKITAVVSIPAVTGALPSVGPPPNIAAETSIVLTDAASTAHKVFVSGQISVGCAPVADCNDKDYTWQLFDGSTAISSPYQGTISSSVARFTVPISFLDRLADTSSGGTTHVYRLQVNLPAVPPTTGTVGFGAQLTAIDLGR